MLLHIGYRTGGSSDITGGIEIARITANKH